MPASLLLLSWALQPQVAAPNLVSPPPAEPARSSVERVTPTPTVIQNLGQFADEVQFGIEARNRSVYFTADGVTVVQADGQSFDLEFGGASVLSWSGGEQALTRYNYFRGSADQWIENAPSWHTVRTPIRDGVELEFGLQGQRLKYAFHVAPGASVDQLLVQYTDCDQLALTADGGLLAQKNGSMLKDGAPVAWQDLPHSSVGSSAPHSANGKPQRQEVEVHFELDASTNQAHLVVGDYDASLPLVVDPEVLLLCGFIGGSGDDQARGIDVDSSGNLFVTGLAESNDMQTVNAYQGSYGGGGSDVWVAKITPTNTIAFLTYLGGSGKELAYDCTVGDDGSAYIAGGTTSADFPYLNGPSSGNNGSLDCFVTKLSNDGQLVYSGTFGGTEFDSLRGNNVDADGYHYVIGRSFTTDGSFPVIGGPNMAHSGGVSDAIVARISQDGSTLLFSGFIGGDEIDYGRDILADDDGDVYAVGWTNSDETTFPVTVGPDLTHNGGAKDYGLGWEQYGDAWVAKFTGDGTSFHYCGFIGGDRADAAFGLALDGQKRVILAGHTTSDENSFPVAVGPSLVFVGNGNPDNNPYGDAWVARVNAAGTGLDFCGYVGGDNPDRAWRMNRSDVDGAIYLVGVSSSNEDTMPHADAGARSYRNGNNDGILFRVEPNGRWVDYSSYFAGDQEEVVRDVCIGPDNRVHVAGWTESPASFPSVTPGWDYAGGTDAFVATLPPFHQMIRSGNLWPDPVTQQRTDLLTVNGQAGSDYRREIHLMAGVPVSVQMASADGTTQPFALYLVPREAEPEDAFHIVYKRVQYGTSVFPMPAIFSSDPTMVTLVNSFGQAHFGTPIIPSNPVAPGGFTWTPASAGSYTLQAIIPDSNKATGYTLSNAVVLRVH